MIWLPEYSRMSEPLRKTDATLDDAFAASLGTVDHLVGNVVFAYTTMTLDDECLAKCEAAYEQFLSDTGATAEF